MINKINSINTADKFFMSSTNILSVMSDIKIKNSEGYDRPPQQIIIDVADVLITPLTTLLNKIYYQKTIPEQWLIAKITPIHKKDPSNMLKNYRPIANLCSISKLFERLILKRI